MKWNDVIADANIRDFFYHLGKQSVFHLERIEGSDHVLVCFENKVNLPPKHRLEFELRLGSGGKSQLFSLMTASAAFYKGPKIVKLENLIDFDIIEKTDLNITLEDYSQPFPTMIIEFPEQIAKQRSVVDPMATWTERVLKVDLHRLWLMPDPTGGETHYPTFAIVHHDTRAKAMIISVYLSSKFIHSWVSDCIGETFEEMMQKATGLRMENSLPITNEEEKLFQRIHRACLNTCLFLDTFGMTKIGPQNPSYYRRLEKYAKGTKNPQQAQLELRTHPIIYGFKQKIKLRCVPKTERIPGVQIGTSDWHGWRRGHWKMQVHGPRNSLRKRIHIEAYYVGADKILDGDLSKTEVSYHD